MQSNPFATFASFKNILFFTDFSPHASPALAYSLALARYFGARLYPAHVMDEFFSATSKSSQDTSIGVLEEQKERRLLRLAEYNDVGAEPLLSRCDFESALPRWIIEYGIDLIVVGAHGYTGQQRSLLGSTAEFVLDNPFCPVLVIGPNVKVPRQFKLAFDKILFPTDLNPHSGAALACALALAREPSAQITLLHVLPEDSLRYRDRSRILHFVMDELQKLLPEEVSTFCKPEFAVDSGEVRERIPHFVAGAQADVIVMGRTQISKSACHMRSGVTYAVIAAAPCPVLTLRDEVDRSSRSRNPECGGKPA